MFIATEAPQFFSPAITCAFLVWVYLKRQASETGKTVDQVKYGMFSEYLCQQLRSPTLKMETA